MQHIVIHDYRGEIPEGSVISSEGHAEQLRRLNIILLPCDTDLFTKSPIAGFMSRHWGPGWVYAGQRHVSGCPLLVYATSDAQRIFWVARVAGYLDEDRQGMLRLTNQGGVAGASGGALSATAEAVDIRTRTTDELKVENEHGQPEWIIGGSARISLTSEHYMAVCLQGACSGIRVLQSAVSLVR